MMLDFDEITPRDVMNTRITLFRRGQNPAVDRGVNMDISPSETIPSMLKHASERLGIGDIERFVNLDGDVIDDTIMIKQDDVLYVLVRGEDLQRRTSRRGEDGANYSSDGRDPSGGGSTARSSRGSTNVGGKNFRAPGDSAPDMLREEDERLDEEEEEEEVVGSFFLGKFLGKGSFGKVHIGTHTMTGEQVALKFMSKSEMGTFQDAERVFTEIQCLNSLDHPNVIKLQQVIDLPDFMVLALEYASGGDLKEVVDELGALNEVDASRLFVQVIDGVTYCHRHNIVHYDLKLENILLVNHSGQTPPASPKSPKTGRGNIVGSQRQIGGEEPIDAAARRSTAQYSADLSVRLKTVQVKIADFGLSQLCNPGKTSDYSAGSLAYIAPEVFGGKETAGAPRDVWAMGVILFAMVTGRLPFMGTTYSEVSSAIQRGAYQFHDDEDVSESCKHLIEAMLRLDPAERMTVTELRLMPWIDHGLPHTRAKTPVKQTASSEAPPLVKLEDPPVRRHSSATEAGSEEAEGDAAGALESGHENRPDDSALAKTAGLTSEQEQASFQHHPPSSSQLGKHPGHTSPHRRINELKVPGDSSPGARSPSPRALAESRPRRPSSGGSSASSRRGTTTTEFVRPHSSSSSRNGSFRSAGSSSALPPVR